jgi:hypothetical protein
MKSRQFKIALILFSILMVLALLGGTWGVAAACGTVPWSPPGHPHFPGHDNGRHEGWTHWGWAVGQSPVVAKVPAPKGGSHH